MKLLGINDGNENPNGTCLQDFGKNHYYLENVLSVFLPLSMLIAVQMIPSVTRKLRVKLKVAFHAQ